MQLKRCRRKLDCIDEELVKLLAKRVKVAKKIGEYKHARNMEIFQSGREDEVKIMLEKLGKKHNVRPAFLTSLWNHVMSEAIRAQEEVFEKLDGEKSK